MIVASVWLGLSVLICAFAWMAGRRLAALLLPLSVITVSAGLVIVSGTPRFTSPPAGHYTVLGARIDVDVAIYALLDDGKGEPRYFKLPYSTSQANALQQAMDGSPDGQGVQAIVGQDGGVSYDGPPPVTGLPPKQAERPAIALP
jgi:hypothetical protein